MTKPDETMYSRKIENPEVYTCANPATCPHALHRMSVEEYKQRMGNIAEAVRVTKVFFAEGTKK